MAVKRHHLYESGGWLIWTLGAAALVGFAVCVWLIVKGKIVTGANPSEAEIAIGIAWVVCPPLWFFFEYFVYFPKHGNPRARYDDLKDAQDLAAKIWAAFVVVLGALLFHEFPRG